MGNAGQEKVSDSVLDLKLPKGGSSTAEAEHSDKVERKIGAARVMPIRANIPYNRRVMVDTGAHEQIRLYVP